MWPHRHSSSRWLIPVIITDRDVRNSVVVRVHAHWFLDDMKSLVPTLRPGARISVHPAETFLGPQSDEWQYTVGGD